MSSVELRIGDLAAATGASRRSLRHYENEGLLSSRRTANGYRSYDPDAVEVVGRIRELLGLGLRIKVVREVLPCLLDPAAQRCPELPATLRSELARLDAVAADLDRSRSRIAARLEELAR